MITTSMQLTLAIAFVLVVASITFGALHALLAADLESQ